MLDQTPVRALRRGLDTDCIRAFADRWDAGAAAAAPPFSAPSPAVEPVPNARGDGASLATAPSSNITQRHPGVGRALPRVAATLVLAGSLAASGCLFGSKTKPPRVFVPPPVSAKLPPEPAPAPELPPPPGVNPPVESGTTVAGTGELPSPPAPPPKPTPPAKPPKPPEETTATVTTPAPAPPRPAQIFSPEEQRAYSKQFDESMDRVKTALGQLEGKSLTAEQRDVVKQIRTFQIQAEQAREADLLTAVNLARRADLLAKDLLGRLP